MSYPIRKHTYRIDGVTAACLCGMIFTNNDNRLGRGLPTLQQVAISFKAKNSYYLS
jgi:hypothetical protein